MGDPTHFKVKGGGNPHTRTRWGTRRTVDRARAIAQWSELRALVQDLGVRVLVVPPVPAWPGTVYPANAGVMLELDRPLPASARRFVLANLLPSRAGEKPCYARVLAEAGIPSEDFEPSLRFEGEADFFPAGGHYLFTHGRVERQRFVPVLGLPPWRRVYGFRTDVRGLDLLAPRVAPTPVLRVELVLEAHYHGDTALCAFGPQREFLLAYRAAIAPSDWLRIVEAFGTDMILIDEGDARCYAANAFSYTPSGQTTESHLVLPAGVSDHLLGAVRERGVTAHTVDVSEFLKKGGGSVKCMIGDLGAVAQQPSTRTPTRAGAPPSP
jgi:N-dimethylarginine dimethylaminohydrolase